VSRYREQRDITQPESLNLFLETRFEQLKTACELEMWAEAFRSVEDIQALIALGKRQPKQQMMATYYRCDSSCRAAAASAEQQSRAPGAADADVLGGTATAQEQETIRE
jgi:hypothetical protein